MITLLVVWVVIFLAGMKHYRMYAAKEALKGTFAMLAFLQEDDFLRKTMYFAVLCCFSNAPFMEKPDLYRVCRMGRRRWGVFNWGYMALSSVFLAVVLTVLSFLVNLKNVSWKNAWPDLFLKASVDRSDYLSSVITNPLLEEFTPYEMMARILIIDICNFLLIAALAYTISLLINRLVAYVAVLIMIFATIFMVNMGIYGWTYWMPLSWGNFTEWQIGYDLSAPDMRYMICFYLFAFIVLFWLSQWRLQHMDWNEEES